MKEGDAANGIKIEGGWDHVRDEYGHLGYLEAKIDAQPVYDEQAHKVSYKVAISEGTQFHFNSMVITGMSLAGERLIQDAWPQKARDVFDKKIFDELLTRLQLHRDTVFKQVPIHYDTVGHWLQTDRRGERWMYCWILSRGGDERERCGLRKDHLYVGEKALTQRTQRPQRERRVGRGRINLEVSVRYTLGADEAIGANSSGEASVRGSGREGAIPFRKLVSVVPCW